MLVKEDVITTDTPVEFSDWQIKVWYHSHVRASASIGENVMVGEHCYIDKNVVIRDNCRIQNGVSIYAGNILEEDVFLGPNCTLLNDINPRAKFSKGGIYLKTVIKKGATIGGGAVILPGITISEYAMVGAGSVVTKDVEAHNIVVGNPAKVIGIICKCGDKRWKLKEINSRRTATEEEYKEYKEMMERLTRKKFNKVNCAYAQDKEHLMVLEKNFKKCDKCGFKLAPQELKELIK